MPGGPISVSAAKLPVASLVLNVDETVFIEMLLTQVALWSAAVEAGEQFRPVKWSRSRRGQAFGRVGWGWVPEQQRVEDQSQCVKPRCGEPVRTWRKRLRSSSLSNSPGLTWPPGRSLPTPVGSSRRESDSPSSTAAPPAPHLRRSETSTLGSHFSIDRTAVLPLRVSISRGRRFWRK